MLGNDHRCYTSGLLLLDLFLVLVQVDGKNSVARDITSNDAMNKMRLFAMREQWCAAAAGLRALWTSGHEAYPPDSYGADARLEVEVLSITHISANRAQVRLRKHLNSPRGTQNGLFTATLMFEFRPENSRSIDDVWQNPFGFTVTEYAIRSDRLE